MMLRDRQLANFFALRSLPLRFALRPSLPAHFLWCQEEALSCSRSRLGRHATPDLISQLEKLDRESLVSNPLAVQK